MTIATTRFHLICGAALAAIAMPAVAQQRPFDVPAESATRSIPEFARQAGIQIVAPGGKLRGLQTPPIKGNYDVRAALAMLIQGSGLKIVGDDGATIMLASAQARLQPASLPGEAPAARASSAAAAPEHADRPIAQSGDIVVTAQRYEQRLQDVPLSITAVSGEQIRARNAQALKDLEYSVPGLSTFEYGIGQQYLQLRGVSSTIGASTVATYLDETPLAVDGQGAEFQIKLLDMERIEVLGGPQATLYGQGSMGGTIRYIPTAPRLDRVTGSLDGQWSSTKGGAGNYAADGVINLPIVTDKVGLRVAAGYEHIGGYIDQPATGTKNINSANIASVRGTLLAKPTERLDVSLLGLYERSKQRAQNFGVNDVTSTLTDTPSLNRTTLVQGKATYDLDFAALSGSASYIDRLNTSFNDISSFYLPVLPLFGFPPGRVSAIGLGGDIRMKIFNSELRLASRGSGPLHWALGATYRDFKQDVVSQTVGSPNPLPAQLLAVTQASRNKSYALYAEAGYDFTSRLKATVGLRYYHEHKRQISDSSGLLLAPANDVNDGNFHSVNPRFNLSYEFSRSSMIYASVAKGFRSGGFNLTSAGLGIIKVDPTYKPDQIWTYEAGTKQQLFDNRLTLDASVYRSVWSGVQSYTFAPGSALTIITNSGHVEGWGVDLSATARPMRALTITGTYGWNNLKFDKGTGDKAPGDPVDGAVRTSYSASLDYRPILSDRLTGIFRVDYQHGGRSQLTLRNFGQVVARPGRDIVNARLGAAVGPVELTVFANNLFDERNPLLVGPFGVFLENIEQRPRVIGLSASTQF